MTAASILQHQPHLGAGADRREDRTHDDVHLPAVPPRYVSLLDRTDCIHCGQDVDEFPTCEIEFPTCEIAKNSARSSVTCSGA